MKIALVHRKLTRQGGVEKNVLLLAKGLSARGHEVHVLCHKVEGEPPPGVIVRHVPVIRLGNAAKYWSFDRNARRAVGRENYDLVQGFDLTTKQDVLRLGRGLVRVYRKVLSPTRGTLDRLWRSISFDARMFEKLETRMLAPGAWKVLVTNSRTVKDELIGEYGIEAAKIEVIHNGIDLASFTPEAAAAGRAATRAEFGFSDADRVVLHVGTGFRRKGVDTLIEALAKLVVAEPRAKLLVVGRDGAQRIYERLAQSLGIADRVIFAGTRRVDSALYGAADVLGAPSRYEPFGNVILEALASGLAPVHPRSGGASEVLEQDGLSRLVLANAEDAGALAQTLASVLAEDRARLSRESRACAEKHSETRVVDAFEALYRRVISTAR